MRIVIGVILLVMLSVTTHSYFFQSMDDAHPIPKVTKEGLLAHINEYRQEIMSKKQKAHCDNPKNQDNYMCMYGAVSQSLSAVAERHKVFHDYWTWINEELNCDRKTGTCTGLLVMPTPEDMQKSLDSYMQICNSAPVKCQ